MSQNIYDDEQFFEAYGRMRRSREGLAGAPEWASLKALVGEVASRRVVDLGCGYGWFCRWAREAGAERVVGIDVSEQMLGRARVMTEDIGIEYRREDLETVALEPQAFDLAYSSLAFHYVVALGQLLGEVHRSLRTGGRLVFSAEHPLYTAPSQPGWTEGEGGRRVWPIDSYLKEGPRTTKWLGANVVKQHRTIGTYVNLLVGAGFAIERIEEWGPSDEQVAELPELAEERDRPTFVLMAAVRR